MQISGLKVISKSINGLLLLIPKDPDIFERFTEFLDLRVFSLSRKTEPYLKYMESRITIFLKNDIKTLFENSGYYDLN